MSGTKSRFLKVKCGDCGNEAVVFTKSATVVACAVCGATLATPRGGLARLNAEVVEALE